jgi:hypothetical protein
MTGPRLEEWRAEAAATATPLPDPVEGDGYDPVELVVGETVVGGAVLTYDGEGARQVARVRRLQTTLSHDDAEGWAAVLPALEAHVRARGARTLVTAVPPGLAGVFGAAGYHATMTSVSKRMDPGSVHELQDDRRVSVRPMDAAQRRRYAVDAVALARAGMERAGVSGASGSVDDLTDRIRALGADPLPPGELLLVGVLDGVPIGRLWATLVTTDDGATDFVGNLIDLFPEFRGRGLTRSFLGALRRELHALDVRDVRGRLYAHDARARHTVVAEGTRVDDVHLRKELT